MSTYNYVKSNMDYIDLQFLLDKFLEKKWRILMIGFSIFSLMMLYVLMKPLQYQVNLLLQIQQKSSTNSETISKNNQIDLVNIPDESIPVQIALIRSKFILEPVIKKLSLDIDVQRINNKFFDFSSPQAKNEIKISTLQVPEKYLNKKLILMIDDNQHYRLYNADKKLLTRAETGKLVRVKENILIKIDKINSKSHRQFFITKQSEAEIIQQILAHLTIIELNNTIPNNQINRMGLLQISLSGNNPQLITDILNTIAETIQNKNRMRKYIRTENALNFFNRQVLIVQQSLKESESKLNDYRSMMAKIDNKLQTQYLLTHLSEIDKQINELRLKKLNLLQMYTPYHPFLISLNKKLKELEKQRSELYIQLKKLPNENQAYTGLKRDVDIKNHLYMILLNQIHELNVVKAGIQSDVNIIYRASLPDKPLSKRIILTGLLSLIIGLTIGCMSVVLPRILFRRVDDPYWTEKIWNIKNVGIISYQKKDYSSIPLPTPLSLIQCMSYYLKNNVKMELFYHLRNYIQVNLKNDEKAIAILGLSKDINQELISVSLAALLAKEARVLLINTDFHNQINQYLNCLEQPGLSDIIKNNTPIEQVLIPFQEYKNLKFLSAGKMSIDSFTQANFKSLLNKFFKEFQYIIINTTSAVNPHSILVSHFSDINLLVIDSGKYHAIEIDTALRNLQNIGIKIHGSIFNYLQSNSLGKYYSGLHHYAGTHLLP